MCYRYKETKLFNKTCTFLLLRYLFNLQYLSLAYSRKFTDKGLQYLGSGKGAHKLIYLDLSGCTQISVDGFKYIAGCNSLQQLEINDMYTLTDNCIIALLEKCQNITSVSLLGSPHLTDAAFKVLAQGRKLVKFKIEENNRITDASLKAITKSCPNLKHIYMADCQNITDVGLKTISTLKNATVLNIADCIRISDAGVRQVVEGTSGAKIRELNLSNCLRVSDLSLLRIAQKCHNITFLSLRYCENVTDSGIELLGNMALLISIDLSGTSITDQVCQCSQLSLMIVYINITFQKFCQQSKDLEQLDVSHCLQVTDATVKSLTYACNNLTSVSIAGCPKVTDLSIQSISGVCHYLHMLDISGCVYLGDGVLKFLHKGCKQLRVLRMLYCKRISKTAALKFESNVKKMEYSNDDPPAWFGYDRHGKLLSSKLHLEEADDIINNTSNIYSTATVQDL
uniref:F-box and leucine rich repeat protein 13 n=1 Tax=Leptobrachium leishanense TaxID=445787 RepID=A0A8C5WH41_9ANUR